MLPIYSWTYNNFTDSSCPLREVFNIKWFAKENNFDPFGPVLSPLCAENNVSETRAEVSEKKQEKFVKSIMLKWVQLPYSFQ